MTEKILRIKCPDSALSKEERTVLLFSQIEDWICSEELNELISLFGGVAGCSVKEWKQKGLKEYINMLNEFVNVWDYRKRQNHGGERWGVYDETYVLQNRDRIMACVKTLGLVDIVEPLKEADYIIPLGGARLTNYTRPLRAKNVMKEQSWEKKTIVALSGARAINDIELPYIQEYAPDAKTEYEAICCGLEKAFDLETRFTEEKIGHSNINLCAGTRRYEGKYRNSSIYALSAPSSDPERRADSYDTFCYLLDRFSIGKGTKLLLVTSCIYVPFQLLKFMGLALENGFEVDCIGSSFSMDNSPGVAVSNYLQEIKATVNAACLLSKKYL